MKNHLLADGEARLLASQGYKSRLRELREAIEARHADEMKRCGPIQRFLIRRRIEEEFRREKMRIQPSKYSLYSRNLLPHFPASNGPQTACLVKNSSANEP